MSFSANHEVSPVSMPLSPAQKLLVHMIPSVGHVI
jgi:hypothetical protein